MYWISSHLQMAFDMKSMTGLCGCVGKINCLWPIHSCFRFATSHLEALMYHCGSTRKAPRVSVAAFELLGLDNTDFISF